MPKDYTRLLAPPDFRRKVDVPNWLAADKIAEGFKLDEFPDVREELHNAMPGRHKTRPALVLGCGPSCGIVPITDVLKLVARTNAVVFATNEVYKLFNNEPFPRADYLVFLDEPLWLDRRDRIGKYLLANPFCVPCLAFDPSEDLRYQQAKIDMGCMPQDAGPYRMGHYFFGSSSGITAIQMALHSGCREIFLLGHDLCAHKGASHGWGPRRQEEVADDYPQGRQMFAGYAVVAGHAKELGARIVNLSPVSKLDCFDRSTIAEEIARDRKPTP